MKRTVLIIVGLAVGGLLAACTTGGGPTPPLPPEPDEELSLGSSATHFYEPGESRLYLVHSSLAFDLIQVELDRDLKLEVGNESLELEFTARSGEFFGSGTAGLGPASLATAAITEERTCNGSCIVFRPFGDFYVQVTNDSGAAVQADLDVFGTSFRDTTEPDNFDLIAPPTIPAGSFDKGAIETVGDVDYWDIPATAQVIFSPQGFPTEAHVVNSFGEVQVVLPPGEAVTVFDDEFVRVRAVDPNRAAIAGQSGYTLEHGNFPATVRRETLGHR